MTVLIKRTDLTIKNHIIERTDLLSNDGKALREVILSSGIQADACLILLCYGAEPIPLQLEQPTFAVEGIADKLRHHGCDHLIVRGLGLEAVPCRERYHFSGSGSVSDCTTTEPDR
jgi:hypothetical protein